MKLKLFIVLLLTNVLSLAYSLDVHQKHSSATKTPLAVKNIYLAPHGNYQYAPAKNSSR